MTPKISIIIPVFNAEKYIHRCIESILSQTFIEYECILVDDCSTDNSGKICDEYAKKDARIKSFHNIQNKGASLTRKIGLEYSSSDYIQFIDSDDWIESNMIELLYQKATSENCDITICGCFYEADENKEIIYQDFSSFDKINIIKKIIGMKIKSYLFTKLVKKELLLRAEFPEHNCSEDYYISIQNIFNSDKIGYVDIPLYHYCYNSVSLSNNTEINIMRCVDQIKNWHKIIQFLREKFNNIKIFEPELSNHINNLKYMYDNDKKLKKIKDSLLFYPDSGYKQWLVRKKIKIVIRKILPEKTVKWIKRLI